MGVTNIFSRDTNGSVQVLQIRGDKSVKTHEYHKWSAAFLGEVVRKLRPYNISGNLYWSESYAARIAPDGSFRAIVNNPAKGRGHFRLLFCFDDGLITGDGKHVRFADQRDIRKTYRSDRGRYVFQDQDDSVNPDEIRSPSVHAR